jgi:hypothetical protein
MLRSDAHSPRGKLGLVCVDWRPLARNTLRGFATIEIVEFQLQISDVAVHQRGASTWAALPSRPWIRDGALVLDDNGKPQYSPIFTFTRNAVRDAFSAAVITAVVRFAPHALDLEEATST